MLDTNDLVKAFKQAAVEAVKAEKPTEITYGKILSADPLMVEVDQKIRLGENHLARGESLQEYEAAFEMEIEDLELEVELVLDGERVSTTAEGSGKMKGKIKLRRSLDAGGQVILVRMQGGQKYVMYDKVKQNDA